jgi:hypothetical protein
MDPGNELLSKIEAARMWSFFHKDWLLQMRLALRDQLPPEYRVFVESEAVIISPDPVESMQVVQPDVAIARDSRISARSPSESGDATAAVVEAEEPCETETHYSLIIRRSSDNHVVGALELLSPSNKGVGNRLDEQKHLRKRDDYLDAGVSLLEVDALSVGHRTIPPAIADLAAFDRIAWTACHDGGRRRYRGWGWNDDESLPKIDWQIDSEQRVLIDTSATLKEAAEFNDWESLVANQD